MLKAMVTTEAAQYKEVVRLWESKLEDELQLMRAQFAKAGQLMEREAGVQRKYQQLEADRLILAGQQEALALQHTALDQGHRTLERKERAVRERQGKMFNRCQTHESPEMLLQVVRVQTPSGLDALPTERTPVPCKPVCQNLPLPPQPVPDVPMDMEEEPTEHTVVHLIGGDEGTIDVDTPVRPCRASLTSLTGPSMPKAGGALDCGPAELLAGHPSVCPARASGGKAYRHSGRASLPNEGEGTGSLQRRQASGVSKQAPPTRRSLPKSQFAKSKRPTTSGLELKELTSTAPQQVKRQFSRLKRNRQLDDEVIAWDEDLNVGSLFDIEDDAPPAKQRKVRAPKGGEQESQKAPSAGVVERKASPNITIAYCSLRPV